MVAVQTQPLEFEAFLAQYPDDGRRYELIEGEMIAVLPTGPHEEIAGLLVAEFNVAIRRGGTSVYDSPGLFVETASAAIRVSAGCGGVRSPSTTPGTSLEYGFCD